MRRANTRRPWEILPMNRPSPDPLSRRIKVLGGWKSEGESSRLDPRLSPVPGGIGELDGREPDRRIHLFLRRQPDEDVTTAKETRPVFTGCFRRANLDGTGKKSSGVETAGSLRHPEGRRPLPPIEGLGHASSHRSRPHDPRHEHLRKTSFAQAGRKSTWL